MIALLLPVVAFAQNMAVQKTTTVKVSGNPNTETRIHAPVAAAGLSQDADIATGAGRNYSVGMWMNITSITSEGYSCGGVIFRYGTPNHMNNNGAAQLTVAASGELTLSFGNDNLYGAGSVSAGNAPMNQWNHVLVVFDSANGNARVYVNGTETANYTGVSKYGYQYGDGCFQFFGLLNGSMDEIQFFNKALSAAEVAAAYGNASKVDGLASLYTFDALKSGTTGQFASVAGSVADQVATFQTCTYSWAYHYANGPAECGSTTESSATLVEGREIVLDEYTVNIAANPAAGGNVEFTSPASSESALATTIPAVTVKATANLGWVFRNWTDGGDNVVSTDPTYTYTGAADVTLTANFVQVKTYTVNITQPENGTITVTADGNDVTSGTTLNQNTVLTISATPASGYQLANYLVNGVATSNPQVVVTSNLTISASFEVESAGPSYCAPSGTTSREGWGINTLTVSDNNGNTVTVNGAGTTGTHPLYTDQSSVKLITEPGAVITIQNNGAGRWMHGYVYVDYNRNGTFEVNEANCRGANVDQELVSHTGYTGLQTTSSNKPADPTVCSDGSAVNNETPYNRAMPSFTIPADLAPGEYRIRHKMDWNCVDPCGRLQSSGYYNDFMNDNGGGIIDFTIKIGEPQYTLTYSATGNGDIEARVGVTEATNPTASGYAIASGAAIENDVYVILTPKQYNGQINTIASATLNGSDVKDMLYTYTANNANEATYYYICIPKADVTEDQVFTAVFEGEVQGIDGIGIDPANGPVEYYNLQGVRVAAENLVPGFYVLRQGSKAVKVFIRK